jgi:hypothetical protein
MLSLCCSVHNQHHALLVLPTDWRSACGALAVPLQRWLGLAKQGKGDKPAYVAFKYYVEPKDKKVTLLLRKCMPRLESAVSCFNRQAG